MKDKSSRRRSTENPKDKVLHTRIPGQLDQHLRDRADNLGLSVSSIVRNVLLNTFELVEDVVHDSANIAKSFGATGADISKSLNTTLKNSAPNKVYGWQGMTLNLNAVCHVCNAILPKGSEAGIGIPASEPPVIICKKCLNELESSSEKS